jgi:hypothetical protein
MRELELGISRPPSQSKGCTGVALTSKRGDPVNISAMRQPELQMSTARSYAVDEPNTSGARYHLPCNQSR